MNQDQRDQARLLLLRLQQEMLEALRRTQRDTVCCRHCLLPYPEGDFESYSFCPWCSLSIQGLEPRVDESRKIIEQERYGNAEIQCGECGGQYEQPIRYPFSYCPHCGAPFAAQDELLIELPMLV